MTSAQWVDRLAADRSLLERTSTVERVTDLLRQRIIQGELPPGTQLSEVSAKDALGVSRNTLREAFRLLGHERLLVHEMHKGVAVRKPSSADVADLYRLRRIVEVGAVRHAATTKRELVTAVARAVRAGEQAAADGDWSEVGTANMRFHEALVGLADSPRTNDAMAGLLAELRLAFHVMSTDERGGLDPQRTRGFYESYVERNRAIADQVAAGELEAAATALETYLADAEAQLITAYAERT
ncbi:MULTISPECIES: GntR family transcriptional regulator [unclassified Saccharopolyspora]|uniref:GntR family transcriptional regulator n=1 Tax=unclassified Saccharopolyspora TaxID=2646250 RepID=UPI001CD5BEF1|nr:MULTISPECIES: GntR family transcriptional regulator [unclassified Saccharopolyspora]MCA1185199.1 GntR family transcriptional regulator [Saccharopolyspora sp. 6T]MCA1192576.1 GntR family transcriptional regulator [Saccharopolyspora sp. 6V]MCA1225288.1 GntR family transcriptional regulator [Saccharopolyspora sp. 6M]MCA1278920.1 GntR family transcriptional regulator [Saccharopolyspora sp. 7B]